MRTIDITRTQYKLNDFISWQRVGTLRLSPSFQRRPVWKKDAKSFLVDTIARGLPVPVIYIRERLDLDSQETIREVVDGQQRLRTLLGFVSEALLNDFDADRDRFLVKRLHNPEIANTPFQDLPRSVKSRILNYEFSTHILPTELEDREVLQMFARLNATGVKLNAQELRNAEWFGEFKSIMYDLALEYLDQWRAWEVLTEYQIARMKEVEITSDLVMNVIDGLTGKTKKRLDTIYKRYDDEFEESSVVVDRFRKVMAVIDGLMDEEAFRATVYTSEVHFFSLWIYLYDTMWGLGSPLDHRGPSDLPDNLHECLLEVSRNFQSENVPKEVLDAVQRASSDIGRREKRLRYMHEVCGG